MSNEQQTKSLRPRLALLAGASLLALVLLEVGLGISEPAEQAAFFTPFEHSDAEYSVNNKEQATAKPNTGDTLSWYLPGGTGTTGSAPVSINNLGLRDTHDYPAQKPLGCYRILVLGDSMTFGKGVEEAETWVGVLEEQLRARYPKRCIEVLNSGMPNINFHVQNLHFARRWRDLRPDLVLTGFFVYNDSQLQQDSELYSPWWMKLVDHYPSSKSSALVRRLYYLGFLRIGSSLVKDVVPRYFEDSYPGWQQFSDSLLDLQRAASKDRFELAFAFIPVPMGYDEYPLRAEHERLQLFLESRGIPAFDLLDGLAGIDATEHWVHPSDGHPDAFVHRAMAEHLLQVAPWDLWLDECPAGAQSEPGPQQSACRSASGQLVGPYARRDQGRLMERGEFHAGLRSGPWMEVEETSAGVLESGDLADAVVHRGNYRQDQRDGRWVEFGLRPGALQESLRPDQEDGGWLSTLLMPDLWSHVARGRYQGGQRAGRWTWVRPIDSGEEELLEVQCYPEAGGELVWQWKAGSEPLAGEAASSGREPQEREAKGEGSRDCPEGQDCSGTAAEGTRPSEENCFDDRDDDGDGDIDCADSECSEDPACHGQQAQLAPGDDDSADPGGAPPADSGDDDSAADEDPGFEPNAEDWTIHYTGSSPGAVDDQRGVAAAAARVHPCP